MSRSRRLPPIGDINVVPYIDVMLVLLVIFMIAAPLLRAGLTVELPRAEAPPLESAGQTDAPLILTIDDKGLFYLNIGDEPTKAIDADVVVARIAGVLRRNPDAPVFISADQSISYGQYVRGQALLIRAGAKRITQVVDPSDANL